MPPREVLVDCGSSSLSSSSSSSSSSRLSDPSGRRRVQPHRLDSFVVIDDVVSSRKAGGTTASASASAVAGAEGALPNRRDGAIRVRIQEVVDRKSLSPTTTTTSLTNRSNENAALLRMASNELERMRRNEAIVDENLASAAAANERSFPCSGSGGGGGGGDSGGGFVGAGVGACSVSLDARRTLSHATAAAAATAATATFPSSCSFQRFPPACLRLLYSLPGNAACVDCGSTDPRWAAASYGALLCLSCSGRHRGLGVQVSVVRSVSMDSWTSSEVLAMLEGGNGQLSDFFDRHGLCRNNFAQSFAKAYPRGNTDRDDHLSLLRYKTKAALFYRTHLRLHVNKVASSGAYRGREASRSR